MKNISDQLKKFVSLQRKCMKHKHTLRANKFGVTWCIGLLSSSIAEPLMNNESIKILINKFL